MNKKSELKGHTWRLKGALKRVVWAEDSENLGTPGHGEEEPDGNWRLAKQEWE